MINEKVFKAILATSKNIDKVMNEVLKHINTETDYDDAKGTHLLEMLVDDSTILEAKDIDIDYLYKHLDLVSYQSNGIFIKNLRVNYIDNIEGVVHLKYDYITNAEKDIKNPVYMKADSVISYLYYPKIIKQ